MIETDGLAILFSWLIFGGLLCILAFVLLRHHAEPAGDSADQAKKPADSAAQPGRREDR